MKKKAAGFTALAILALLAALYLRTSPPAPSGQDSLKVLARANFAEFEKAFDAGSNAPRLLLLLSPT